MPSLSEYSNPIPLQLVAPDKIFRLDATRSAILARAALRISQGEAHLAKHRAAALAARELREYHECSSIRAADCVNAAARDYHARLTATAKELELYHLDVLAGLLDPPALAIFPAASTN